MIDICKTNPRPGLKVLNVRVVDNGGSTIRASWFNDLPDIFNGETIAVYGKYKITRFGVEVAARDYVKCPDKVVPGTFTGLMPVYPLARGITRKLVTDSVKAALHEINMDDFLPDFIRDRYKLPDLLWALKTIHFPDDEKSLNQAKRRLAFDELFLLQLALRVKKESVVLKPKVNRYGSGNEMLNVFLENLPFKLTASQLKVWREINADISGPFPMRRLLLGDVGSGKTVVAAMALLRAVESDLQGIVMAPTEILARQHYETINSWFADLGIRVALVTGSNKDEIKNARVIVGTHALIREGMQFDRPGIVVIDEQHRFGVGQRLALQEKTGRPDLLVMTATPIPRTLALAAYGDMELSVMDGTPPGRKPVKTFVTGARERVWNFLRREIEQGRQCYVICPLVEESSKIDAENADTLCGELAEKLKPHRVGLVHGRMDFGEKSSVMDLFKRGELNALVSTTVIEVGVNVPNATAMVITGAERFGLAQLHQLRGRVGRGEHQSYCILLADPKTEPAMERLKAMVKCNDGFRLAEMDLKLRGPGEFFGEKQSGLINFKLASLNNARMMEAARAAARKVSITQDLLAELRRRFGSFMEPDISNEIA